MEEEGIKKKRKKERKKERETEGRWKNYEENKEKNCFRIEEETEHTRGKKKKKATR